MYYQKFKYFCFLKESTGLSDELILIFGNFLKIFYLFIIHERQRERERQREKQAPHREPNVGLDPGSPGSHPELKAVLNC